MAKHHSKTVLMNGGIGNQLFQLAFAYHIQGTFNSKTKIDLSHYQTRNLKNKTHRNFGVSSVIIGIDQVQEYSESDLRVLEDFTIDLNKKFRFFRIRFYTSWFKIIGFVLTKKVLPIYEDAFVRATWLTRIPIDQLFIGYWQNKIYVKNFLNSISNTEFGRDSTSSFNTLSDFQNVNAVAIHVRRGDYMNDLATRHFHGLLEIEYYLDAIRFVSNSNPDSQFFIFSDDVSWCRNAFKDIPNIFLADDVFNFEDTLDEILIMSKMPVSIISNSSFSWWSVIFNKKKSLICSPNKWFKNEKANTRIGSQLIESSWTKFDVSFF